MNCARRLNMPRVEEEEMHAATSSVTHADTVNRERIPAEIARLESVRNDLAAAMSKRILPNFMNREYAEWWYTCRKIIDLQALFARLRENEESKLLLLAIDGQWVRAVVALEDPSDASHVFISVPGMDCNIRYVMKFMISQADNIKRLADDIVRRAGRADEKIVPIVVAGYDAPQREGPGHPFVRLPQGHRLLESVHWQRALLHRKFPGLGWWDLISWSQSRRAGDDMGRTLRRLREFVPARATFTVLAHSYGSTVIDRAIRAYGPGPISDVVMFASPGLVSHSVEEWGMTSDHAYNMLSDTDYVHGVPNWLFGRNPKFGDYTQLGTDEATTDDGVIRLAATDHRSYSRPGTISEYNMAAVVAGMPELATRRTRPPVDDHEKFARRLQRRARTLLRREISDGTAITLARAYGRLWGTKGPARQRIRLPRP